MEEGRHKGGARLAAPKGNRCNLKHLGLTRDHLREQMGVQNQPKSKWEGVLGQEDEGQQMMKIE